MKFSRQLNKPNICKKIRLYMILITSKYFRIATYGASWELPMNTNFYMNEEYSTSIPFYKRNKNTISKVDMVTELLPVPYA